MVWLLQMEQTNRVQIKHERNVREYRPTELPNLSVDGYCPEMNSVRVFRVFLARATLSAVL